MRPGAVRSRSGRRAAAPGSVCLLRGGRAGALRALPRPPPPADATAVRPVRCTGRLSRRPLRRVRAAAARLRAGPCGRRVRGTGGRDPGRLEGARPAHAGSSGGDARRRDDRATVRRRRDLRPGRAGPSPVAWAQPGRGARGPPRKRLEDARRGPARAPRRAAAPARARAARTTAERRGRLRAARGGLGTDLRRGRRLHDGRNPARGGRRSSPRGRRDGRRRHVRADAARPRPASGLYPDHESGRSGAATWAMVPVAGVTRRESADGPRSRQPVAPTGRLDNSADRGARILAPHHVPGWAHRGHVRGRPLTRSRLRNGCRTRSVARVRRASTVHWSRRRRLR